MEKLMFFRSGKRVLGATLEALGLKRRSNRASAAGPKPAGKPKKPILAWFFPEADFAHWQWLAQQSKPEGKRPANYHEYYTLAEDLMDQLMAFGHDVRIVKLPVEEAMQAALEFGLPQTLEGCYQAMERLEGV